MEKDLFDLDDETQAPEDDQPVVEAEAEPESGIDVEAEDETPAEEEESVEEADSGDQNDDGDVEDEEKQEDDDDKDEDKPDSSAEARGAEKKPEESKPVNVVEQDPYDFNKCLITIAMALIPDDGNPEGRPVMLGVRNHQDEPLLAACRLSDLMPLPDPVQQLLEQLKADLPVRSERTEERRKAEEAKRKALANKKTTGIKPASAKARKAEKPVSVNLFEMFDQ